MSTTEQDQVVTMYCYHHPTRETGLRCNQCGRPICASCAIHTPTGYRCRECVRGQQKAFDTAQPMDYVWAVVISGVMSFLGGLLAGKLGYFTVFASPLIGIGIGEVVRRATGKRRSKRLFAMVAITCVVAGLPLLFSGLAVLLLSLRAGMQGLLSLWAPMWQVYHIIVMTGTAYYRLSGSTLRWRK